HAGRVPDLHARRDHAPRCFFQAEDGIRGGHVTGVQMCALPISALGGRGLRAAGGHPPRAADRAPRRPADVTRRRAALAALAAVVAVLAAYPAFASGYGVRATLQVFMWIVLASSWNLISGLTGYVSF